MDLREIHFGVEIETVRRTRQQVARAVQSVVGGERRHVGSPASFDPWEVVDEQGRTWKVVSDGSPARSKPTSSWCWPWPPRRSMGAPPPAVSAASIPEAPATTSGSLHLEMIGDEFKTARKHLLAALPGDSAFRLGRPPPETPPVVEAESIATEAGPQTRPSAFEAEITAQTEGENTA